MSTLSDIKIRQVHLLKHIVDYNNFQVDQIRFCDYFIDRGYLLMEELSSLRGASEVKDFFVNALIKTLLPKEKMIVLLGKISVVCCEDALYQSGYMNLVSQDEMHNDCRIDLPFARVENCVFYLEDNIRPSYCNALCFNCKFNFVNSVC